jgi:ketosteroid isomerase-like protein
MSEPPSPPADWYTDPQKPDQRRYWDGQQWTEHTAPIGAPPEDVERLRRGFEHFAATGEFLAENVHADFVWDMSTFRGWPEQQTYLGLEGARQFNSEWAGAWDDWEIEAEDYIDAGERIVVILRQRGRSKATGVPVDMRLGQVWTLQDGQGIRMQMYATPEEALEAAGLQE